VSPFERLALLGLKLRACAQHVTEAPPTGCELADVLAIDSSFLRSAADEIDQVRGEL
jgi:hypothetical protein